MKKTLDNSKLQRILACKNEGNSLVCPCPLSEACSEYVEENRRNKQ